MFTQEITRENLVANNPRLNRFFPKTTEDLAKKGEFKIDPNTGKYIYATDNTMEDPSSSYASEETGEAPRKYLGYRRRKYITPLTGSEGILRAERIIHGKFFGGKLDVLHVVPNEVKEGANPVIFFPGFVGDASRKGSMPFAEELARAGEREVYVFSHVGYRSWKGGMESHSIQQASDSMQVSEDVEVPVIDKQKVELVTWFLNQDAMKDKKVDLVAHSMGVGAALITATGEQSDRINKIYIAEGAMNSPEKVTNLVARFLLALTKESALTYWNSPEARRSIDRLNGAVAAHVVTKPTRVYTEASAIAKSDYARVVEVLQAGDPNSSRIFVETAGGDSTFKTLGSGSKVDEVIEGGHNELIYKPQVTAKRVVVFLGKELSPEVPGS